jgi:hypothetical protein
MSAERHRMQEHLIMSESIGTRIFRLIANQARR